MRYSVLGIIVGVVLGASPVRAWDAHLTANAGFTRGNMTIYGLASPPPGYVAFCQKEAGECSKPEKGSLMPSRITMTPERRAELEEVNALVNLMIRPVNDLQLYGQREFWTYPLKEGDCEDYVLLKRRMLLSRNWPASVLLITVVRDEAGEGHAVLTVVTNEGDLILDNKHNAIRHWSETSYKYIKRQSAADPLVWNTLAPSPPNTENYAGVSPAGKK